MRAGTRLGSLALALLVSVCVVAAALPSVDVIQTQHAAARMWMPQDALAPVAYNPPRFRSAYDSEFGYPCDGCWGDYEPRSVFGLDRRVFPYEHWASPAAFFSTVDAAGRLVTARTVYPDDRPRQTNLVLETRDARTLKVSARRTIALGRDLKVFNVLMSADDTVYVLLEESVRLEEGRIALRRYVGGSYSGQAPVPVDFDSWGVHAVASGETSLTVNGSDVFVHISRYLDATLADDLKKTTRTGYRHEASLAFRVDTTTMTAIPLDYHYVSHSMNQIVRSRGERAVFADHGDGTPRAITLRVLDGWRKEPSGGSGQDALDGTPVNPVDFPLLSFPGRVGENFTGATLNGMELSGDATRALTVGLSQPQDHPVKGVRGRSPRYMLNAFWIITDLNTGKSQFRWLTTYNPKAGYAAMVTQPRLVPLGQDRFVILFTARLKDRVQAEYRLVDASGRVLASRTWKGHRFVPISQPVVAGKRILWVGAAVNRSPKTHSNGAFIFGLNVANPRSPRLL